jgi:hypothetical protein
MLSHPVSVYCHDLLSTDIHIFTIGLYHAKIYILVLYIIFWLQNLLWITGIEVLEEDECLFSHRHQQWHHMAGYRQQEGGKTHLVKSKTLVPAFGFRNSNFCDSQAPCSVLPLP